EQLPGRRICSAAGAPHHRRLKPLFGANTEGTVSPGSIPLTHYQELIRSYTLERLHRAAGPAQCHTLRLRRCAETKPGDEIAGGAITGAAADPALLPPTPGFHRHPRSNTAAVTLHAARAHREPVAALRCFVVQQHRPAIVHRDQEIDPAVAVVVPCRHPARHGGRLQRRARGRPDLPEASPTR